MNAHVKISVPASLRRRIKVVAARLDVNMMQTIEGAISLLEQATGIQNASNSGGNVAAGKSDQGEGAFTKLSNDAAKSQAVGDS